MSKRITRSTVNDEQYSAQEFPHSGFAMSYRRYANFQLGKIHIGGFHWCMPGDKISGKTTSSGMTFERIVTPLVSPVNAMQYNVFLPLRPLDRSFKKGITPTRLNQMSANWTMPLFNTRYLVDQVLRAYMDTTITGAIPENWSNFFGIFAAAGSATTLQEWYTANAALFPEYNSLESLLYSTGVDEGFITMLISNLTTNGTRFCNMADQLYMRDNLLDVAALITAKLGSAVSPLSGSMLVSDFLNLFLSTILDPWVGRYSYYAELKYEFLRPFDFYRISRGLSVTISTYDSLLSALSDTPQNEYAIRMMYAVWYELFRNVDLEPVSATLPDWQEWSSTSIFDMSAGGNLCYLLYRFRSWENDMFVSAQIDDLSRHVWAPITSVSDAAASYHVNDQSNLDTQENFNFSDPNTPATMRKPSGLNIGYRDQLTDQSVSVWCPLPTNINDILSAVDKTFVDVYGLDLNTLRQTQMLERYLKRNYLFGDEYQDRMLAHYNSRVSDMRINKPEILSQSMDGYDMGQQVSNVSTDETKVGDRTATATIPVNGEEYTTFCEEFGIVLSLVCFMPRSMYDGTCPQNYLGKCVDLPLPEFATNNEEFGRKSEIAGSGLAPLGDDEDNRFIFGRYPAYHAWRSRVDEVGGKFLDEMQDCTFRRFFGMFSDDTTPKLNYFFIHCRPNLQMFADSIAYDGQIYGDLVHECFVERVLPTPVEVI